MSASVMAGAVWRIFFKKEPLRWWIRMWFFLWGGKDALGDSRLGNGAGGSDGSECCNGKCGPHGLG